MVDRRTGSFRKEDQLEELERRGVSREKVTLQEKKKIRNCHLYLSFLPFPLKSEKLGKTVLIFA